MRILIAAAIAFQGFAFTPGTAEAAGGDSTPPKPTNTTKKCLFGRVWDANAGKCVKPNKTNFTDDELYQAVRELAYDGQYGHAQDVLRAMSDQNDDRVLTYWGFTYRKMGELELANLFYERAISANPDNILARSYMGQGFVLEGKTDLAVAQWREIKARGGEGSWAETSLRDAIRTGLTYSY
ncbi:tetratricopeptide repeat protein [Ruegeria sediminis]|uniref:Tetratricopeptide repeat protein n=1 Tax=Ruegeria sediminis TaxID=2583820 RepID=A0ABY2WWA4_9RHOB|nr:tetratricopeptide repeat protein [Ruegeria sediminis]TMV06577.1 tetratricopeptide repeat protein [Ruegeria sediminis]